MASYRLPTHRFGTHEKFHDQNFDRSKQILFARSYRVKCPLCQQPRHEYIIDFMKTTYHSINLQEVNTTGPSLKLHMSRYRLLLTRLSVQRRSASGCSLRNNLCPYFLIDENTAGLIISIWKAKNYILQPIYSPAIAWTIWSFDMAPAFLILIEIIHTDIISYVLF